MVVVKINNKDSKKILSPILYKCKGGMLVFPYSLNILKKYLLCEGVVLEEISLVFSRDNEIVTCNASEIL
jgi:hypothetical protein